MLRMTILISFLTFFSGLAFATSNYNITCNASEKNNGEAKVHSELKLIEENINNGIEENIYQAKVGSNIYTATFYAHGGEEPSSVLSIENTKSGTRIAGQAESLNYRDGDKELGFACLVLRE